MAENDILLREVDEDLRRERMMNLWNQFKRPLIYAAVALILVTAGSSMWHSYQQSQAEEVTIALNDAQQLYAAKQYEQAAKQFEAITHRTRGDLADMSKLWNARSLLAAKKNKSAMRVLQNIVIAPEGHDLFWRDLACLHIIGAEAGAIPETCSGNKPSPLAPLLTQLYAAGKWSEGDAETARTMLGKLAVDADIPTPLRSEANAWETTIRAKE